MKRIFVGLLLILSGCMLNSQKHDLSSTDEIHFTVSNGSIYQYDETDKKSSDKKIISKIQDMVSQLELDDKNKVEDYDGLVGANTYTLQLSENEKTIIIYTFYGSFVTMIKDDKESIYKMENMKNVENLIDFLQKI